MKNSINLQLHMWLFAVICISGVAANQQYITLFDEKGQNGVAITVEQQVPDVSVSDYEDYFKNASSYCAVGWWVGYTNKFYNVDGGVGILLDQKDDSPSCADRIFSNFKSLRYLGNRDTDVPHISFYTKSSYHGLEVGYSQTEESLSVNLGFSPLSFATTGWSNWTFYEGLNSTGSSWCFESTKKVTVIANMNDEWPPIKSLSAGCNSTPTTTTTTTTTASKPKY